MDTFALGLFIGIVIGLIIAGFRKKDTERGYDD
jgi:hypothetical protein